MQITKNWKISLSNVHLPELHDSKCTDKQVEKSYYLRQEALQDAELYGYLQYLEEIISRHVSPLWWFGNHDKLYLYAMVKKLNDKIDDLQQNYKDHDDSIRSIDSSILDISNRLSELEDLKEELSEIHRATEKEEISIPIVPATYTVLLDGTKVYDKED